METILEDINKIALKLLSPYQPDEMYKTIVEEGKKLINCEYGSIFLEKNGDLQRVYASDELFYKIKSRKEGHIFKAYSSHQPSILSIEELEKLHPVMREVGVKSVVIIPLSYKDDSIGALTMQSLREEHFTTREIHILKLFGSMASMAIKKSQLYDETKKALETRDLFISLASHELRTPLTSINGYVQLLYGKFAKKDTAEAKWVQALYDESIRLTHLVKELLEINKIKQGQLQYNLQECSIEDIVDTAVERYSFINKEREIIYKKYLTKDNITIIGDPEKLMQMLTALLNNADKFSFHHTPIEVTIKNAKTQVSILVRDHGEGIVSEDHKRIFEGFYKSGDTQSSGLGVGLLLAKHIIQYHHGSIALKSKVKKGTVVEVKLPIS